MYKMADVEMNTASTEEHQEEEILSPSEKDSTLVLSDTPALLDFSKLTPCQFGISVQSFTPVSLSNCKDKSRLAQIKARRRSNIGARGSPETNSLIRFMAQQRMKSPPALQSPELVRSSPFLPRVASTLRQKMASFQSLMDVEESEVCDPMPAQDSNTGGCIKTRDYLSDGSCHYGEKENHPPMRTPVLSKRRRMGPPEGCEVEIREASAPTLHFSLKEQQEEEEAVTQVVTQGPLPSSETVEEVQAVLISPTPDVDSELQAFSPAKNPQVPVFEHQSLGQPPPDDPAAAPPAQPAPPFPSLPSLSEMKPKEEADSNGTSAVKKKEKKVHFGGPLSPEYFDKNLPPSTPLQKGGTPARAPTLGGSLQPRSALKTPQRHESQTPAAQLDLSSPTGLGASPVPAMPRSRRMQSVGEDSAEEDVKIVFPTMEEIDSAEMRDTDFPWDTQPLNLNTAFHEESLSQLLTESETKPGTTSQTDALDEPTSLPEKEKQHEAGVEAPAQLKKQPEPEQTSTSEAPARSSSRKRKQPEESEPVKRSTRSAAKSASGKMKMNSTAARRWNKDVDRSLYSSRAYASKNPALSPIRERRSLTGQSPAAQQTPSMSWTALNNETHMNHTRALSDVTVTNSVENPSEDSVTSPVCSEAHITRRRRRSSEPRVRGRGLQKRKVSVADDVQLREDTRDQIDKLCETTINHEASGETPLDHTVPEQVDTLRNSQTPAETHCTDSAGKLECDGGVDVPTSDSTPPAKDFSNTHKARRGRRSSLFSSVPEEHQTSQGVEEKRDQAASQQENIKSSFVSQEDEGAGDVKLEPWQADFNFEDVFKPVATRGQRSVRRSLRNQSNAEHGAGLAWLPRTSPDSSKESRRRTRGRRLSAALPVHPEDAS